MKKLSLFDKFLFFINSLLGVFTLFGYVIPFLNPSAFGLLSVMSLSMPLLLFSNAFFLTYWLLKLKKQLFVSLVVLGLGYNTLQTLFRFQEKKDFLDVRLRFVGYVKLWVLAAIFLGIDLIQIPSGNAGGHLAHLGGALFGYFSVRQLGNKPRKTKRTTDKWFSFKKPLKTVYKSKVKTKKKPAATNQEQIDHILDKISKSGYDSLNQQEKDLLFRQGKK